MYYHKLSQVLVLSSLAISTFILATYSHATESQVANKYINASQIKAEFGHTESISDIGFIGHGGRVPSADNEAYAGIFSASERVYPSLKFATKFKRLDEINAPVELKFLGGIFGLTSEYYYFYESDGHWSGFKRRPDSPNPDGDTIAIIQEGPAIYGFINAKRVESFTLKRTPQPGPVYLQIKGSESKPSSVAFYRTRIEEDSGIQKNSEISRELPKRQFPSFIDIPAQYTITTNKGCRLNNPSPKPNETVTWSGPCRNGYADGHGTMAWFENGKPSGEPTQEYMSKGFFLKPGPYSIFRTAVGDDNCRIVVPVNAVENMKSLFSVEYDGKCPRNASNLLHQDSTNARANILFNGQLFASFNGTVAMGAIPISGEMVFFNGTKFKFNGQNPFSGIVNQEQVNTWFKSIDVVRGSSGAAQASADSFNIKIGFNAKPSAPVEASDKILFFPVETIAGATSLKMRYDIGPAPKAKLTASGYVVSLKAEVKLDKTTSMGWFGVGENNSIVKLVDVRLDKKNGYRATGEVLLSELQSYAHGMGVTITNKASRPTVTVVGLTEEQ